MRHNSVGNAVKHVKHRHIFGIAKKIHCREKKLSGGRAPGADLPRSPLRVVSRRFNRRGRLVETHFSRT